MRPDGSVVYTAAGSELTNSRKNSSPSIRGSAARAMRSKTGESKELTFPNLIASVMAATQSQPSPRKGPKDQRMKNVHRVNLRRRLVSGTPPCERAGYCDGWHRL